MSIPCVGHTPQQCCFKCGIITWRRSRAGTNAGRFEKCCRHESDANWMQVAISPIAPPNPKYTCGLRAQGVFQCSGACRLTLYYSSVDATVHLSAAGSVLFHQQVESASRRPINMFSCVTKFNHVQNPGPCPFSSVHLP